MEHVIQNNILKFCPTTEVVTIPDGAVRVGGRKEWTDSRNKNDRVYQLFVKKHLIREVNFPDCTEVIGEKAFERCRHLKTVRFGKGLCKVELDAFAHCHIDDVYYPLSLLDLDRVELADRVWPGIKRIHCSDCTVDFTRNFYVDELNFDGTKAEFNARASDWVRARTKTVHCTDGDITPVEVVENEQLFIRDGILLKVLKDNGLDTIEIPCHLKKIDPKAFSRLVCAFFTYPGTSAEWKKVAATYNHIERENVMCVSCSDRPVIYHI